MNTLKRFGSGSKLYTFPANSQVNYSDNFASLITKTSRMAGVNGGLSALGTGRGLSPIGTVRADIWLKFNDYVEATDNVASLRQMADWGLMPLWRQPLYGAEQFCWARLTDLPRQEDVKNVPHKQIKIPVTFEVPDPFWYRSVSGRGFLWDDGSAQWDDGTAKWDLSSAASAAPGTFTYTQNGNYYLLPRIQLVNSFSARTGIRISRIVEGMPEDDIRYTGTLASGTYLDIDPVRRRVSIGPVGTNALANFSASTPDWFRLMPGSNTIKVEASGSLFMYISYLERFI